MKLFKDEPAMRAELLKVAAGHWQLEKEEDSTAVHFLSVENGFYLRVQTRFPASTYDALCDVLDTNLESRQKEWHALLEGGGRVQTIDADREVMYFRYRSPFPFSSRDCVYAKLRVLDDAVLRLLYWTIETPARPAVSDCVRIDFKAMHELRKDEKDVFYSYVQWSDPKIHLPDFLLKRAQVDVLFGEVKGLRSAINQSPK